MLATSLLARVALISPALCNNLSRDCHHLFLSHRRISQLQARGKCARVASSLSSRSCCVFPLEGLYT
jgi:hypothetical protein